MALPSPKFYSTGNIEITITQDFGECQAGEYSTGKIFRLYNNYGSTTSETMTSVKVTIRDDDGGTDEDWVEQHWVQLKSDGCSSGSTGVMTDDAQTLYTAVGKNKELSVGDIPSDKYRTLYARCYPPTDAEENPSIKFQLRATYQQPATSICNWITGLRGNGVVASTGNPFAMYTGGTTGTIPYEAGYALINNNEIYYGSSGTYDCSTGTSSTGNKIYLTESGSFGMTTGDVDANQLLLYGATISSGVCTALDDKRVYLAGLQSGTTGARPANPDLGDLYFGTNGKLYGAKTAGIWTVIVPGATFVSLTDTPDSYSSGANKLLRVDSSSGGVEFVSSTGILLDNLGEAEANTDLDATTGHHGLLPALSGSSGEYLNGDGGFAVPQASEVEVSEIGTATYDDVQDLIDNTQSGGRISGGTIADDSSGGITISSGTGFIKSTTGDIGLTKSFDWSADSLVSTGLTDNSANYIYMDYNAGTPQILATADRTSIRTQDQFDLGRIYKSSGDLHILNSGINLYNFSRRMHDMKIETMGFIRASGGVITESTGTERALDSSIGKFYLGDNSVTTTAQDTSTGGSEYFTTHYYIDGAWTSSTGQQQIDNTYYNDITSTGLETLTVNRYGVHWAYIHFDSDINVVYGQGDYTLAQAENASLPGDLPSIVEDFGTLAAKIILQKTSTGFTSVVTAYKTLFPVSSPADHNDLGGLDTGNYQHLTQAEHDEITEWAGAVTLSTGGAINLVTFSTGGTVNVPSGQEYQINGSEVKLDEWATPTDVTTLDATTGRHGLLLKLDGNTSNYLRGDGSWQPPPGTTGGEANTASNVNTTGVGVYEDKVGIDLQFKGIHSTGDISVTDSTGTHTINLDVISTGIALDGLGTPSTGTALNSSTGRHGLLIALDGSTGNYLRGDGSWQAPPGATGGEANTASNAGTTGIGIYYTKSTYDLQFKAIHSTGNILVTDSTGTHTVNLDVDSTGIALDSLGTPSTGATLDSSTGRHGLLIALDGSTGNYLRGDGTWDTPPGATGAGATTFLGLTDTPANYAGAGGKVVKVTTGEDALEFVSLTVFHETFMDVRAANSSGIHTAIAGSTSSEQTITADITNPDVPRNTSITVTQNASPSGDITIYGTFPDGTTGDEAITSSTAGTVYGDKAFAKVSQFIIPVTVSSGDTVSVGWSDKIGLCNSFDSSGDIFKLKKDAVDISTGISGNTNPTYNTLDCGTITDYDDIEIWYKL